MPNAESLNNCSDTLNRKFEADLRINFTMANNDPPESKAEFDAFVNAIGK
jgi:hypothetical protein